MSGQFNKKDFEQNPAKLKKKKNKKDWSTNNASELCSEEVLSKQEIKEIQEDNWVEKHVPKPSKREQKYSARINQLENDSLKAPLSKKESRELKKLSKKRKKLYKYRHRDLSSNHFFLKCCTLTLIVVSVISCALVFGGYKIVVEPRTGITLSETFSILNGLFKVDEKDIINQTIDTEKDSQQFFDSLKTALYLNKSFSVDDLLSLIPESNGGTGDENASVADLFAMSGQPVEDENASKTGNINFDKLLEDTKFDFSALKDFNESSPAPVWEITDKSIAAVMQQVLSKADEIPAIKNALGDFKINIAECVAVRQCKINKNADDDNTMTLTIQVKIRNLVSGLVEGVELGSMDKIVTASMPLILKMLPESIYLSAITTPQVDKAPTLGINAINGEVLQRLISNIDKNFAKGKIESVFNSIGKTIFSTIKTIDEMAADKEDSHGVILIPSSDKEDGSISINVLQAAMHAMKIQNVTSSDFLLMVKHLHLIDLENGNDIDKYLQDNYNENKTISEKAFNESRDSLFSAYGVDPGDVQDITADNFLDSLKSVQDKISLSNTALYEGDYETLQEKSKISDSALGYVMNNLIKKELNANLNLEIKLLDMKASSMDIVAALDLTDMLKSLIGNDLGALEPLLMSVFPKHLFIKIIVPYVDNDTTEGVPQFDVIFNYMVYKNSDDVIDDTIAQEKSDAMFKTLAALMSSFGGDGESFNKETIVKNIKDAIYPALENMNIENSEIKIEFSENGIQFPTVFDVMASLVNKDESSDIIEAATIRDTLENYYTYNNTPIGGDYSEYDKLGIVSLTSDHGFVRRELEKKFFMKAYMDSNDAVKPLSGISDNQVFDAVKGVGKGLQSGNIKEIINIDSMKQNQAKAQDGNLGITARELGKLISMSDELNNLDIGFYKNFKFIDVKLDVSANTTLLTMTMVAELDKSIGAESGFSISNFATELLYMNATVNLSEVIPSGDKKAYKTSVKLNDVDENNLTTLIKIISKMANGAEFDKTSVENSMGEAFYSAFSNFEEQGIKLTASNSVKTDLGTEAGFTSTNVYELVGKAALSDKYQDGDDEHLKNIIHKLNNPNGYTSGEFAPLTERDDDIATNEGEEVQLVRTFTNSTSNEVMVQIAGTYIGRQFRKYVKTLNGFDLTRFAIFNKPVDNGTPIDPNSIDFWAHSDTRDFTTVIDELAVGEDKYDIFQEYCKNGNNGLMFIHFKVDTIKLLTQDSSLRALLPTNIYSGAFLDLSKIGSQENAIMYSYINNLSADEMALLTTLVGDSDITAPVMNTINDVITQDITVQVSGHTESFKLSKILELKLYSSNNDQKLQPVSRSYYEGKLSDLFPTTPDPNPDPNPGEEEQPTPPDPNPDPDPNPGEEEQPTPPDQGGESGGDEGPEGGESTAPGQSGSGSEGTEGGENTDPGQSGSGSEGTESGGNTEGGESTDPSQGGSGNEGNNEGTIPDNSGAESSNPDAE